MADSCKRPFEIDILCREATQCRACFKSNSFESTLINPSTIDIAQPRWIGDDYWLSSPRVCVVMLNPGAGKHNEAMNEKMNLLSHKFKDGNANLDDIFELQRNDFVSWGRPKGRFLNFFQKFNLCIDAIAFVNIAWCSTKGNKYPKFMLNNCMSNFTIKILSKINPDIVTLSGNEVHKFDNQIEKIVNKKNIFKTLHYAHRKNPRKNIEKVEQDRFADFLKSASI